MNKLKVIIIALVIAMILPAKSFAANSVKTYNSTITNTVTANGSYDYTITATTPFSGSGNINITNTDHAVVIFKSIKPSVVKSTWLSYIKINGEAAADGTNCQVKMYNNGAIVFPYASDIQPLTCYTGQNYTGTSSSDYGLGNTGGYMNTLTSAQLLNQIRSFKLKRGYMVTFAVGTAGWGYSRCFIADKEDLEMSTLPTVLDGKISSYRIFKWNDAKKSGLANDITSAANNALNTSWCYNFNIGSSMTPDQECVPHRIQIYWPGIADIGKTTFSANMKTDNEPANSSDDNPATVSQVLGYWQDVMRTGMRLCSPSTHDAGYTWLNEFMTAIDERGWRCDVVDLHCYWIESQLSGLATTYNTYKRPIWISELLWGASWNSNGIFAAVSDPSSNSTANQTANYNGAKPILDKLNGYGYVERYAWWNSENVCSKVYYNSALTTLGEYYSTMDTGLGYNKDYEYIPTVVLSTPNAPTATVINGKATVKWTDPNGDMVDAVTLQYSTDGGSTWTGIDVTPKDKTGSGSVSYSKDFSVDASSILVRVVDTYEDTEYTSSTTTITTASGWITAFPANYTDFYYMIYSEEAATDLCWTLGWNGNVTDISYQTPQEVGTTLNQIWQIEENATTSGTYSLRNLGAYDYVMCSPNSWNFITNNTSYHVSAAKTAYLPEYNSDGYWTMKNCNASTYVGLWDNDKAFAVNERLAGNRTLSETDHLKIYAISKSEFNETYIDKGNTDVNYTIKNPNFTWGTTAGTASSGASKYPANWTFKSTQSGWVDNNVGTETINETSTYRFNAWSGTFTYAELMQTISNLPNGIYKISADMATTADYARTTTKTAIYGNPSVNDSIARSYNLAGIGVSDYANYDCYVAVDKNKLTIGVRSDGTWFKVANFKLEYVCSKDEAIEDVLGYIDNGRALQAVAWSMGSDYFDFSKYTNCRNFQIDQTPVNAFARMAGSATIDEDYRNTNVIVGNRCANVVLTDALPLTIKGDSFTADAATYKIGDDTSWTISNATFPAVSLTSLTLGDANHDGAISLDDVKPMTTVVLGNTTSDGLTTFLSNIRKDANGKIDIDQLTELIRQLLNAGE